LDKAVDRAEAQRFDAEGEAGVAEANDLAGKERTRPAGGVVASDPVGDGARMADVTDSVSLAPGW
jgi:hypothetical protein